MKKVAVFEKVSEKQFETDIRNCIGENIFTHDEIIRMYHNIELPKRATSGSAGYDFKIPFDILMKKGEEYLIPTGIRCNINKGWVLKLYPKSGLGTKRGVFLSNTIGIIDSDYYNSDNEGHIMVKIGHRLGKYILHMEQGQGFIQGMFERYGITKDDKTQEIRNGGFGSTEKRNK